MISYPFASTVIRNKNGLQWIGQCIHSVLGSNYPHFEVIVVDDGSTDTSVEYLMEEFLNPSLRIVALKKSVGPASASNVGIKYSKGEYIAFLDNDAFVTPDWLRQPIELMEQDPSIGIVQCTLLKMDRPSEIECLGHYLHALGHPIERIFVENPVKHDVKDVFGAKQAAMVVRSKLLGQIGHFDEAFHYYFEETDLCWRALLTGYRVVTAPKAIVYHKGGGTVGKDKAYIVFHREKNTITSLIKNYDTRNLVKFLPLRLITEIIAVIMVRNTIIMLATLRALVWVLKNLRTIYKKRLTIQQVRKVPDSTLFERQIVIFDLNILLRYLTWRLRLLLRGAT